MPSINFVTRVITIPQSELTLIGGAVYQLDANVFRLAVLDIMDGPGIIYPDVFRHNTAVTLGGVTYARFIEIINGYTLMFENGNYAVRVIGANTNFEDVTNVNSVSVRSANSAGLIQVSSGSGLSSEQDSRLTAVAAGLPIVQNLLEADERIRADRYQKLLPGTNTVILDKDVTVAGDDIDLVEHV